MTSNPPLALGLAITVIAYIIGTVPFGVLVSRLAGGDDPRTKGSGNIGCTNVLRVAGRSAAAATLVLDAGKGVVAVLAAQHWTADHSAQWAQIAGIGVVLGHTFPVWTGFRGGKGVATGIGALVPLAPALAGVVVLVWALVLAGSRYVSLASVIAAVTLPIAAAVAGTPNLVGFSLVVPAVVVLRHRDNLTRLLRGTESRLGKRVT